MRIILVSVRPPARERAGIASSGGKLYVLGGKDENGMYSCFSFHIAVDKFVISLIFFLSGNDTNEFYEFNFSPPKWTDLSNATKGAILPNAFCHILYEVRGHLFALMSSIDEFEPFTYGKDRLKI